MAKWIVCPKCKASGVGKSGKDCKMCGGNRFTVACPSCEGKGKDADGGRCGTCGGGEGVGRSSGEGGGGSVAGVDGVRGHGGGKNRKPKGHFSTCPTCRGSGKRRGGKPCPKCGGGGVLFTPAVGGDGEDVCPKSAGRRISGWNKSGINQNKVSLPMVFALEDE